MSGTETTYAGTPCATAPMPAVVVRPYAPAAAKPAFLLRGTALPVAWNPGTGTAFAGTGIPTGSQLIDRGTSRSTGEQLLHVRTTPGDLPPGEPLS